MPQNLTNIPLFIKIIAVVVGALFALTLTGDIDKQGRLHINTNVIIKLAFSTFLGFLGGDWVIEYLGLGAYSYTSHGFIMMLMSVFGMTVVGVVYQAFKLSTTDKTLAQIVIEIKTAFKAIFK